MQAAIALDPRREYYEWLVVQYEQAEEFGRASWWLGRYLEGVGEGGLRHAELRRWLDRWWNCTWKISGYSHFQ